MSRRQGGGAALDPLVQGDIAVPDPLRRAGAEGLREAAREGVVGEGHGLAVGADDLGEHAGGVPVVGPDASGGVGRGGGERRRGESGGAYGPSPSPSPADGGRGPEGTGGPVV